MNLQNITNSLISGHEDMMYHVSYHHYPPFEINAFFSTLALYFFIVKFIILII